MTEDTRARTSQKRVLGYVLLGFKTLFGVLKPAAVVTIRILATLAVLAYEALRICVRKTKQAIRYGRSKTTGSGDVSAFLDDLKPIVVMLGSVVFGAALLGLILTLTDRSSDGGTLNDSDDGGDDEPPSTADEAGSSDQTTVSPAPDQDPTPGRTPGGGRREQPHHPDHRQERLEDDPDSHGRHNGPSAYADDSPFSSPVEPPEGSPFGNDAET